MAYEVRDGRTTYTFDDASSTTMNNGHLYVYDSANNTIATFAPGHWTNVTKVGAAKIDRPRAAVG